MQPFVIYFLNTPNSANTLLSVGARKAFTLPEPVLPCPILALERGRGTPEGAERSCTYIKGCSSSQCQEAKIWNTIPSKRPVPLEVQVLLGFIDPSLLRAALHESQVRTEYIAPKLSLFCHFC